MSNLDKFAEAVQADLTLQARVKAIRASSDQDAANQLAALAHQAGIPLSPDEVLAADSSGELDLDHLDAVVGGFAWLPKTVKPPNPGGSIIHHIDP